MFQASNRNTILALHVLHHIIYHMRKWRKKNFLEKMQTWLNLNNRKHLKTDLVRMFLELSHFKDYFEQKSKMAYTKFSFITSHDFCFHLASSLTFFPHPTQYVKWAFAIIFTIFIWHLSSSFCPSSINYSKNLWNHWVNFNQSWSELFFGCLLSKLYQHCCNRIGGVMVSVLASSVIHCGMSPDRVKPKTIKCVFVTSPLITQHQGERVKTVWLGIWIMGRHVYKNPTIV
jgi:hypothetical protein